MALSNYEKQKRWREKNRALYNLQQRNRRKKILGVGVTRSRGAVEAECRQDQPKPCDTALPSIETKKVGELRMVVIPKSDELVETGRPLIFRDDYGRVITERQWNILQSRKERAKEGGYSIDEYSQ